MHGPDGHDYKNKVRFIDIRKPHSIIYKHLGDGEGEPDVSFEAKITFEELERIKKKYGAIEGAKQHIGNFAKYLETLKHA